MVLYMESAKILCLCPIHLPASTIARKTPFTSILKFDNPNSPFSFIDVGYAVQKIWRGRRLRQLGRLGFNSGFHSHFTVTLLRYDSNSSFGSTLRYISLLSWNMKCTSKMTESFLTVLNSRITSLDFTSFENVGFACPQITRLLAHY
jgi:hypothetical protein